MATGKDPDGGSIPPPILLQFLQQAWRQDRVSIFASLALHDSYLHPRTADVFEFQMASLAQAQPCPINRDQKGPMFGIWAADSEKLFQLLHAEDLRSANGVAHAGDDFLEIIHRPVHDILIKPPQST